MKQFNRVAAALMPEIGQTISHYRITEKLGEGGMGVVYRARDEQLEREVAIKVLPPASFLDNTARARLLREAKAAAALNHPNICTVHEVGEADGQAYIAMELVQGRSLSEIVALGPLATREVVHYSMQLADALAHAHDHDVVHRDLKSANIIVTPEGRAKILDFGLARRLVSEESTETATAIDATLTRPGTVVGTLAYMAPEQLRGQAADGRSDIWALGIVLHEMAGGERAFRGTTGFELTSSILKEPPAPLPAHVPPDIKAVILRCLEKEPSRRYQRASELYAALEALQTGTTSTWIGADRPRRRGLVLASAVCALLFVLVAFLVLNIGGFRNRLWSVQIQSIAVLPFENLSRDPEQAYFANGIQEDLITDLAKLRAFKKVIPRPSTMQFQGSNKPLPEIARALGVDVVVTGAVRSYGGRVKVSAQLTKADTQENLWANDYERPYEDLLAVQNEIVAAIAQGVKLQLNQQQQAQLSGAPVVNKEAYDAYMKGIDFMSKATPDAFRKGAALLEEATQRDPGNALAWATLALAYDRIGHAPAAPPDVLSKAMKAAIESLKLDPNLAEGHSALAQVKAYSDRDWDWEGAGREYRRALELNPDLATARGHYAWYLLLFGRREDAIAEMRRAQETSPLDPEIIDWLGALCSDMWFTPTGSQPRPSLGIEQFLKGLEINPRFPLLLTDLGRAYGDMGRYQESIEAYQKAKAVAPEWAWGLGITYAQMGKKDEARQVAEEFARQFDKGENDFGAWGIAEIYSALGDKDQMFKWLQMVYQQRHPWAGWIRIYPPFNRHHDDPRYQTLLRRMKLPA